MRSATENWINTGAGRGRESEERETQFRRHCRSLAPSDATLLAPKESEAERKHWMQNPKKRESKDSRVEVPFTCLCSETRCCDKAQCLRCDQQQLFCCVDFPAVASPCSATAAYGSAVLVWALSRRCCRVRADGSEAQSAASALRYIGQVMRARKGQVPRTSGALLRARVVPGHLLRSGRGERAKEQLIEGQQAQGQLKC